MSTPTSREENLDELLSRIGVPNIRRHIFLCCDQTKPKCAEKEKGLESWDYLKRRLVELGLTGTGGSSDDITADAGVGVRIRYEVNLDTGEVKGYIDGTLEHTVTLDLTGVGDITKLVFQAKKNWSLDNVVLN